jgi:cell division protein FtsZ
MSAMGTAMMGTASAKGPDRAQEAAEAAISSPLLEDVDLTGAKGILVNITAGMDIAIEEFETVGNHVKALASENATVVVGAVIDPDMSEELRVTVVATGLGGERKPQFGIVGTDFQKVSGSDTNQVSNIKTSSTATPGVFVPSFAQSGSVDTPETVEPSVQSEVKENASLDKKQDKADYFDVPTFLRNQAD